jgi:hypothetical protein
LSKEPTSYAKICEKIGAGNPQNANWGFGSIHWILQLLQDEPKFSGVVFPDITSIVTNRDGKTAGRGAFRSNKTILDKSKKDQIEWLKVRRKDVFRFRRWPEVLAYLGIAPMSDLSTSRARLESFSARASQASGESPEHLSLKNWVASNAKVLARTEGEIEEVKTEFIFWSLDRLDVYIRTTTEWVGIEVKPTTAKPDEVRRGLYQVVKYSALLQAELLAQGSSCSHRCLLVLGGGLPGELRELARRLGITPIENVCTRMNA